MTKETFEHTRQWRNFENRDWEDLSSDPYLAIEAAAYHLLDLKAAAADHYAGTAATMRRDELIGAGYRSGFTAVWNLSRGRESAVTRAEMRQYVGYIEEQWSYADRLICQSGAFVCSM